MATKFPEYIKTEAIGLYKTNKSIVAVSKKLGVPKSTIAQWVKGMAPEKSKFKRKNKETVALATKLYNNGYTTYQIEAELGIAAETVQRWMRKAGIIRHRGPQSKVQNENFFETIDNEEKAYYLGWLMADANLSITNGQYSLKIHIGNKDSCVIEQFLRDINASYIPYNKTNKEGYESVYISITSIQMCKDLMNYGIQPRKSGNEIFPEIPLELEKHFIRGYFDGDGITCIKKEKRSGFIAPHNVLEEIQARLNTDYKMRHCGSETSGVEYFQSGKKFSKKLYDYIYTDATIWMPRKRMRMDIICGNTEITDETKISSAS